MINISFTQFLTFAVKNGSSRVSTVKKIKYAEPYHPGMDYWKEFRDAVRKMHCNNLPAEYLDSLVESVSDKKRDNYRKAVNKYKAFIKKHKVEWFDPPKAAYTVDNVKINVNHELGLIINGVPHLVKMLISKDASDFAQKKTLKTTLALSNIATEFSDLPEGCICSVFDIPRGRLHDSSYPSKEEVVLLNNEIRFFENLYNDL